MQPNVRYSGVFVLAGFGHIPENGGVNVDLSKPVRLESVDIGKPWGREIWFTGMETRGESRVLLPTGERLPLSAYLAIDPCATCDGRPVLLLKVLDPKPAEVLGDLYFEVHEEKREVYVVTAISSDAASPGIRFGMNQQKRKQYPTDADFRAAFLDAVKRYERVRRRIDDEGQALAEEEARLRKAMNAFTQMQQLDVGDVVCVPTWTPHALQHGVRVVEFQTQTYERLIVSFAQKVLTQDHWDSERAITNMHLDTPAAPVFEQVADGIERIARFEDFNVWRVAESAGEVHLPEQIPYAVCMAVGGSVSVGPLELESEQAAFVSRRALAATPIIARPGAHGLIAAPEL